MKIAKHNHFNAAITYIPTEEIAASAPLRHVGLTLLCWLPPALPLLAQGHSA